MNKKDRLLDVFERLRYEKVLSTKKEFAERIGFDKTNLSSAFSGSEKYLTDNLFNKIADAFPQFDRVWLLTGEGEMLKTGNPATPVGDASQPTIDRLLSIIESQQRTIETLGNLIAPRN